MLQVAQLVISRYPRPVQIIMIYFQLWSRYLYDSYFWYFHIGWKTMIRIIMRMNCLQFYRGPIVILLVSGSVGGDNINKRHFLHNYIQEFIQQVFSNYVQVEWQLWWTTTDLIRWRVSGFWSTLNLLPLRHIWWSEKGIFKKLHLGRVFGKVLAHLKYLNEIIDDQVLNGMTLSQKA